MEADPEGATLAEQNSAEALRLLLGVLVRDARRAPVLLAASLLTAQKEPPRPPNATTNGALACDPTLLRPSPPPSLVPEARHHLPQLWHQLPLLADLSSTSRSALWPRPQLLRLHP